MTLHHTGLRFPYLDGMRKAALAEQYIPYLSPFRKYTSLIILSGLLSFGMIITVSPWFLHSAPLVVPSNWLLRSFLAVVMLPTVTQRDETLEMPLPKGWVDLPGGDKKRIAILYSRVSTLPQVENFSLAGQFDDTSRQAQVEGFGRVYPLADPGKSGREYDHRVLTEILDLVELGVSHDLFIVDVDRIGREFWGGIGFLIELRRRGVTIHTPTGVLDLTTLSGKITAILKLIIAEDSNNVRRDSAVRGKREGWRQGNWNKSNVPKGYKRNANNWLDKIPEFSHVVEDIYRLFLATQNFTNVAAIVNSRYGELLKQQGMRPLTPSNIEAILADPTYKGEPEQLREKKTSTELAFIGAEVFDRAQPVLSMVHNRHRPKKFAPIRRIVKEFSLSALAFLAMIEYHHRGCGGVFSPIGTREKGTKQQLKCEKCGNQYVVPTEAHLKKMRSLSHEQEAQSSETEVRPIGALALDKCPACVQLAGPKEQSIQTQRVPTSDSLHSEPHPAENPSKLIGEIHHWDEFLNRLSKAPLVYQSELEILKLKEGDWHNYSLEYAKKVAALSSEECSSRELEEGRLIQFAVANTSNESIARRLLCATIRRFFGKYEPVMSDDLRFLAQRFLQASGNFPDRLDS